MEAGNTSSATTRSSTRTTDGGKADATSTNNSTKNGKKKTEEPKPIAISLASNSSHTTVLAQVRKLVKNRRYYGKLLQINVDSSASWNFSTNWNSIQTLLRGILKALPDLERIEISTNEVQYTTEGRMARWSIGVVASMLTMMNTLKLHKVTTIRLCFLRLFGTWDDFSNLATNLKLVPTLEKFNLDKISLEEVRGGTTLPPLSHRGSWLDPVVLALAELPKLYHLRVLGTTDFRAQSMNATDVNDDDVPEILRNDTLRRLCKSSLKSLCLIHFNLSDDNVTHMAEQLETNTSLKELDIDCTLGTASSHALMRTIERNPVLEDLNLCIRCKGDELGLGAHEETADSIERQQEELLAEEDEINLRIAKAVGNSSLINFALFRGRISPRCQDAFRTMLRKQSYLESLTLYTGDEALNKVLAEDPHIKFYLKINKHGRRQLQRSEQPSGRWKAVLTGSSKKKKAAAVAAAFLPTQFFTPERCLVDTLGRVKDDTSCLYYFLSLNPSLCDQQDSNGKRARTNSDGEAPPSKRTRLYRAAKYKDVCYTKRKILR